MVREVKDLQVGDLLVSSDGTKLAIDKIEKELREATVYNFEVADFNSYLVSNLGIWVHNCAVKASKSSYDKPTANRTTLWDITKNYKSMVKSNYKGKPINVYEDSRCLYWTKDLAGHGESGFKVFKRKGKELEWYRDTDPHGNFISPDSKH